MLLRVVAMGKLQVPFEDPGGDCTKCRYWGYWNESVVRVCVLGFRKNDSLAKLNPTRPKSCERAEIHEKREDGN